MPEVTDTARVERARVIMNEFYIERARLYRMPPGLERIKAMQRNSRVTLNRLSSVLHADWEPTPAELPSSQRWGGILSCTCVFSCADDPATACSLSGDWHVHPASSGVGFGPCPTHPDAPGDL